MPTEDICQNFNELRSDLVLLYELKLGLSTCEYELQALRHQYEALAPGKTLEIPPSLLSNNDPTIQPEEIPSRPKTLSEVIDIVGSAATPMLDETTPVYNLSNHTIMRLFELKEQQRLSTAKSFMKKIEDFKEVSRRSDEEECLRKKQELEERLVPKRESQVDVERTIQRLQDEARQRFQQKEDQINQKLKEIKSIQEKELQENLKKKALELRVAEAKRRKGMSSSKLESLLQLLNESVTACQERDSFLQTVQTKLDRVTALKAQFQVVVNNVNHEDPLNSAIRSENIVKQVEDLVEVIRDDIAKNNAIVQEKNASSKRQQPQPPLPSSTVMPVTSSAVKQEHRNDQHGRLDKKTCDGNGGQEDFDFVRREDLVMYSQLQTELRQYEANTAAFSGDLSLKTLRFELQKAVLHPVNEISDQSGQHLQDKLDRLRSLLQGNSVHVGSKMVRATEHPGGLEYCTNLLARRLVAQGEDQVNVNPKAAFPIAAIITELWLEFPVFGRLVLAHFYRQCPYLVPYYLPQQEGQSNEDYYKSLGYRYSGGKVEQQPTYLKRMSGVVRLYAAVLISLPRRNQPHPHGLEHAWRYLAALLNLSPRNDITAAILVEFLTVAGSAMSKEYGKQFQKMLHLICTEYFTMIRNVTPKGSGGGPVTRLEEFLHESIKKGGISPPAGQLSPRFW
uniref:mRNA export factor GLE1 n=1 Tax=Daphnia lumholtzi TaxID=42856 RepID=A0A4Y7M8X6_9CRUS|nr:EOG090X0755 [Daphnia lumholtzi]